MIRAAGEKAECGSSSLDGSEMGVGKAREKEVGVVQVGNGRGVGSRDGR